MPVCNKHQVNKALKIINAQGIKQRKYGKFHSPFACLVLVQFAITHLMFVFMSPAESILPYHIVTSHCDILAVIVERTTHVLIDVTPLTTTQNVWEYW